LGCRFLVGYFFASRIKIPHGISMLSLYKEPYPA
jgi:hypothetical protein